MFVKAIMEQLDKLYAQNRGEEARRLLLEAMEQAAGVGDRQALLTFMNELMGYYRETSSVEASYELAEKAMGLMKDMRLEGTLPYATTLLNIANAYRAGGRLSDSMDCYRQAEEIYGAQLTAKDMLKASLYNNISLLYQEMGEFGNAKEKLLLALEIVSAHEENFFETAVTHSNLAATCLSLNQEEEAAANFGRSIALFEQHQIQDAHYCSALSALGTYQYKKGNYGKAAENFRKAMAGMKAVFGENEYYHRLKANLELCESADNERDKKERESKEADEAKAEGCRFSEAEFISAEADIGDGGNQECVKDSDSGRVCEESVKGPNPVRFQENIKGLALSRAFYEEYGKPMIESLFGEYQDKIAVGLVGEGSDCFGWDDIYSRDHDWGPGFCMWITEDTDKEIGGELREAYRKLPEEFMGFHRKQTSHGAGRLGVFTICGFYRLLLGENCTLKETAGQQEMDDLFWQNVSDAALAASVNGEVFRDHEGIFTLIREGLKSGYPEHIRYLKTAESAASFAQAGQYNYARMLVRGDTIAARIMLTDAIREAAKLCHYLSGAYPPHGKWLYKSLENLKGYEDIAGLIRKLSNLDMDKEQCQIVQSEKSDTGLPVACPKDCGIWMLEEIAVRICRDLYACGMISDIEPYLDVHTEELLRKAYLHRMKDQELAEAIVEAEFEAFDKVRNVGGRASCQNDWPTFSIMRKSQYLTWSRDMLIQYLYDFQREASRGHNLIEEKYARMMSSTAPEEYARIEGFLTKLEDGKNKIVEEIVRMQVSWMEEFEIEYPGLAGNARSIHTNQDTLYNTSYETYLRGELSTYSDKMLELYGRYIVDHASGGRNLAREIMTRSTELYGYRSLEDAESKTESTN